MKENKTLTITLSAVVFLMLSAGVTYAASDQGFRRNSELTDVQKEILAEARDLRQSGDFEAAHELIEDSGIQMFMGGFRGKISQGLMQNRQEVREAIENDDYEAFVQLTENNPMHVEINEDDFNKLVEAHSLRIAGDHEGAREIVEGLGLGQGRGFGPHQGMMRGLRSINN